MQFPVNQIGPEGLSVDETLPVARLEEILSADLPTRFTPTGPVRLTGRLQRTGDDVVVQLAARFSLRAECAGCLKAIEPEVSLALTQVLKPAPRPGRKLPEELELTGEDLEEAHYTGDVLDLWALVREQIILALPMFPRCSESCLGLCPSCGADRNTVDCGCQAGEVDPRWAALKALKAH